jgi:hypothetical protein
MSAVLIGLYSMCCTSCGHNIHSRALSLGNNFDCTHFIRYIITGLLVTLSKTVTFIQIL